MNNLILLMQLIVNLTQQQLPDIIDLPLLNQIIFLVFLDTDIASQISKISKYLHYLQKNIHIKTTFKIDNKYDNRTFKSVVVGGTFDHLHLGHQVLLLTAAITAEEQLRIGITGQAMLIKKKGKNMLQPWIIRKNNVERFVHSLKPHLKLYFEELNDGYGITINKDVYLQGIALSQQTLKGGEMVNKARAELQLHNLQFIICPTISVTNNVQNKLSSSFIRQSLLKKNNLSLQDYQKYKSYYNNLIIRLCGQIKLKSDVWWSYIFERYSEGWRYYHTNQHIYRLLTNFNRQNKEKDLSQVQVNVVQLAIFFHDVVYYPSSSTNEEDSAKLFQTFINEMLQKQQQKQNYCKLVTQLILQTKNHQPTTHLSQILYDLDMGILNDKINYKEYAKNIKKQFKPFVKEMYNQKRLQFLRNFLSSKLYFSFKAQNFTQNCLWEIKVLEENQQI